MKTTSSKIGSVATTPICGVWGDTMSAHAMQPEFAGFPVSQASDETENPVALYLRISAECGGLIPQGMLPSALGVSQQRVSQLVLGDRLEVHKIGTIRFVTARSLEVFLKEERAANRSYKPPKFSTVVHGVKEFIREHKRETGQAA